VNVTSKRQQLLEMRMVLNHLLHQKQTNIAALEKVAVEVGPVVKDFMG